MTNNNLPTADDDDERHHQQQQQPTAHAGIGKLLLCAVGICTFYLIYGLLQEHLFTAGDLGPTFVLVTASCTNSIVALLWDKVSKRRASTTTTTTKATTKAMAGAGDKAEAEQERPLDHRLLMLTSLCFVLSMACSNEAVPMVSYPTAVLAKSCKLVPTVVFGSLNRSHSTQQWIAAITITLGILIFQYTRIQQQQQHKEDELEDAEEEEINPNNVHTISTTMFGMILLWTSLLFDGILALCQDHIKHPSSPQRYRVPTAMETMLYINAYAVIYLIPLSYLQNQIHFNLLLEHWTSVLAINLAASGGQIFIFLCLDWFSPIITTTITTTRKFITILISVWTFGHHFTTTQWTSIVIVFSGLYMAIIEQQQQQSSQQPKKPKIE